MSFAKERADIHFTPDKVTENAFIESFNGKMRNECLNEN
ncbi:integrase core domain protein [Leptospira interrogans serovar Bataviae str. L1111]|nr:integrase core domain protein [Leptospira interrogans serovar Bataviae str. L1111]